jgi:hypothetical protein
MKEVELSDRALQSLRDFESLEEIQVSPDWTRSMLDKLGNSVRKPKKSHPVAGIALVLFFFILANLGFVLSVISDGTKSMSREKALRAISDEFLINPTSIHQ